VKFIADSSRLGLLGAESDLSLVGAYGYDAELNRAPTALLVLVFFGKRRLPRSAAYESNGAGATELGKGPMP
jgi:hypothetical protein